MLVQNDVKKSYQARCQTNVRQFFWGMSVVFHTFADGKYERNKTNKSMKKVFIAVSMLSLVAIPVHAQETKDQHEKQDTISLGEVVVKASRIVRRVDGQTIFPSEAQKKNS